MTSIAEPAPLIAQPIWDRTRASFARCVAAIGAPAAFAAMQLVPPALRRRASGWLLFLENVVRKLLLAEAAELQRAETAKRRAGPRFEVITLNNPGIARLVPLESITSRPAPERVKSAVRRAPDPARPETWRVRFSFALPRDPRLLPKDKVPRILAWWETPAPPPPPPPPPPRVLDESACGLRLARRLEALRRVLENPMPHAQRLMQLCKREIRRFPKVVMHYAFAPARTNDRDPQDYRLSIDAIGSAIDAPWAFDDTS